MSLIILFIRRLTTFLRTDYLSLICSAVNAFKSIQRKLQLPICKPSGSGIHFIVCITQKDISTIVKNVFHLGKNHFLPGWKTFLTWVENENAAWHRKEYITEMSQYLLGIETFYSIENNTYRC